METINIYLPNPDKEILIKNFDKGNIAPELNFQDDAKKLYEMLADISIGTVRALFQLLKNDNRINLDL